MSDFIRAVINIDGEEGASVTMIKESGITSKKYVSIEGIQEVLLENFQFATGFLPAGARWYSRGNDQQEVFMESPPSIRGVSYSRGNGLDHYTIPVPWTLWGFVLKNRQGKVVLGQSNVWAMKNPITPGREKEHQLYTFPFSNVSGGICWGSSASNSQIINGIDTISKSGRLIELFWSAPFNSDLDGNKYEPFKNENGENISHCHGLLQYLDKKDRFPYEILKESSLLGSVVKE